ncbi:hypothetical protein DO70_5318 [Burkholderia pseudomallei]|nr:hypothetical protein DO70_5318 [Burkholderia pseudomallei]
MLMPVEPRVRCARRMRHAHRTRRVCRAYRDRCRAHRAGRARRRFPRAHSSPEPPRRHFSEPAANAALEHVPDDRRDERHLALERDHVMEIRAALVDRDEAHHAEVVAQRAAARDPVFDQFVFLIGGHRLDERRRAGHAHLARRADAVAGGLAVADPADSRRREDRFEILVLAEEAEDLMNGGVEFFSDFYALLFHTKVAFRGWRGGRRAGER